MKGMGKAMQRRKTKQVQVGSVSIGGDAPIAVQSMLCAPAQELERNVADARALKEAGCEIVRVSIPDKNAVRLIDAIKSRVDIPLVADIHFDYKLALESVAAGVDKIRINPGNIGGPDRVKAVADACRQKGIPIRIGVNSGSIEKSILRTYGGPTPEAMAASAMEHVRLLNQYDFDDIVLSLKSSNVENMVKAYQLIAARTSYPLHLGVTEAGTPRMGIIKSSCGIGALLLQGIGDTIRVSLTAPVVEEVRAGFDLLSALDIRRRGIQFISCPTCGRTKIDLVGLAEAAEERLSNIDKPLTVAIMGCAVNGPGEAEEADIGIAGGNGEGLLFKKGQILYKVPESELLDALIREIETM